MRAGAGREREGGKEKERGVGERERGGVGGRGGGGRTEQPLCRHSACERSHALCQARVSACCVVGSTSVVA